MEIDEAITAECRQVLVVDDSPTQRLLLAAHLRRWGYEVREAQDGESALAALAEDPAALVLSDWMMPGLDGPSLCRKIREAPGDTYTYVVLLTARTERAAVSEGLNAGADDFLLKPVNPEELKARLKAGARVIAMQRGLAAQQRETETALNKVRALYEAIENDLSAASVLQREQLPAPVSTVNGCTVATLCRFAGHVGGDHVGHFPIGDNAIGLFSIDVAGHGIASSLLAIRLAQYFAPRDARTNIAVEEDGKRRLRPRPPEAVVRELDQRCRTTDDHDIYFTMAYAVVELGTGRTRLCQAGHSPAAIIGTDGTVRYSELGAGPPVGLLDDAEFCGGDLILQPGERLMLYSDGIPEANLKDRSMLGQEGMASILKNIGSDPIEEILPRMLNALEGHQHEASIDDDVSAILFEFPRHASGQDLSGKRLQLVV